MNKPQAPSGNAVTAAEANPQAETINAVPDATQKTVIDDFRSAFNHKLHKDVAVCAYLTPAQEKALQRYRQAFNLRPKERWATEQLPTGTTPEELVQIQQLHDKLKEEKLLESPEDAEYCGDLTCLRFLRARDHNLAKAHRMLVEHLAWRREVRPWTVVNTSTLTDKSSSDARVVGFDRQGRAVLYSSFANTTLRQCEHVRLNTICLMEKALRLVNACSPGKVMWVNHFGGRHKNGFNMWDANPRFAWTALNIFEKNYPECLQTMIVVDPPAIFFNAWKAIKPLLPEKTAQKGEFVDSRHDNTKLFNDIFGEELAAYLLEQMKLDA